MEPLSRRCQGGHVLIKNNEYLGAYVILAGCDAAVPPFGHRRFVFVVAREHAVGSKAGTLPFRMTKCNLGLIGRRACVMDCGEEEMINGHVQRIAMVTLNRKGKTETQTGKGKTAVEHSHHEVKGIA